MFPDPPCNLTAGDRQAREKNLLWGFKMSTVPAHTAGPGLLQAGCAPGAATGSMASLHQGN